MPKVEPTEIPIEIRSATPQELPLFEAQFSPNSLARYHHRRFAVQERGEGVYLIAWHGDEPVGHFLLRWNGPDKDSSTQYPKDTVCFLYVIKRYGSEGNTTTRTLRMPCASCSILRAPYRGSRDTAAPMFMALAS